MTPRLLIGIAIAVAILLTWLAWDGLLYLQRGYSLRIEIEGEPGGAIHHIDFPPWRIAAHVLLLLAPTAAILTYIGGRAWASAVAGPAFVATMAMGTYDVVQYGTIGSPTSIWTVLLLLFVALLTTFGRVTPAANA